MRLCVSKAWRRFQGYSSISCEAEQRPILSTSSSVATRFDHIAQTHGKRAGLCKHRIDQWYSFDRSNGIFSNFGVSGETRLLDTLLICLNHADRNPSSTRLGTSAANQGPNPSANACAMPNLGMFRCHNGWKCSVRQIFPPRYILTVFPCQIVKSIVQLQVRTMQHQVQLKECARYFRTIRSVAFGTCAFSINR